jgi:hypothetical protein
MQKRLYEIEVIPPVAVWDKLSLQLDEINADNEISNKVSETGLIPPPDAWQNISASIGPAEKQESVKKGYVINFRKLAAAALFIGVIVTAWVLLRNNSGKNDLAGVQNPVRETTNPDTNTVERRTDNVKENDAVPPAAIASEDAQLVIEKIKRNKNVRSRSSRGVAMPELTKAEFALLNNESPHAKSFDQPIDDLSLVTADQHYMTMVNSNGRLVKIPAELAHLAPHLQDKPIPEDIYEVMFGEGTYWKETMSEWRRKVASLPVSSGDAFTSFIELLKTVQDK